ncbi:hypothetical protein [Pseudokineococcus lusitanus]|uniref:Polyketide cyclase/dehydrase/lipid transport protein n=1 Tax=Pseudokineococcus lusitanus TaxID=763993 RepID=A0A3N1GWZ9_9ACTN|nr:hypothetical protein [Pseudokineococcus lusitanus]ROP34768.1 hypothetical protein EDC03_2590 [Pseudokineococcus lusitanus]
MTRVPDARDTAAGAARSVVGAVRDVARKVGGGSSPSAVQQTLTVGRSVEEVATLWRDPAAVRRVLGDAGDVAVDGAGDRWTWRLATPGGGDPVEWETVLADGGVPRTLRWSGPDDVGTPGQGAELVVTLRQAPQDLGTEQVLRLALPVPDLAAGAMALTLGYRARSLLLTGETPELEPVPAAR